MTTRILPHCVVGTLLFLQTLSNWGFGQTQSVTLRRVVPHNSPRLIQPGPDGALALTAVSAAIFGGEDSQLMIREKEKCVGLWKSADDYVEWNVEVPRSGDYDVHLHWAVPDKWARNFFAVQSGTSRFIQRVQTTGGFNNYRWAKYGTLRLLKGRQRVTMRPIAGIRGELADLKQIKLMPSADTPPDIPAGGMLPRDTVSTTRAVDGLSLSLFASEPMVTNPTSLVVDAQGRIWVTEIAAYRVNGAGGSQKPRVDRIKVLEDTDGDGTADEAHVFYEGLMAPMSLAVAGQYVYVAESPYLYIFEDKNQDLVADGPPRILLEGFGGYNDDQALHGLALGPDHKLYMTQGDLTFDVTGPDGRHVKHDVGAVLRCEMDGSQLEVLAWDLKNPIEVAVDSFGNSWFSGNDDDGQQMCRLDLVLDGGYYGWRSWNVYGDRRRIYGSGSVAHWHTNEIGVIPPIQITGAGSPCGKLFIEHDFFGKRFQGSLLQVDPGPRMIRAYHLTSSGAAYAARGENFVANEQDTYFRPIDAALAPDGKLYVCDWYDGGVGGHAYDDPTRGRVYCVESTDATVHAAIARDTAMDLPRALRGLANPNLDQQFQARDFLLRHGERFAPQLVPFLTGSDPYVAARAVWVLDRMGSGARRNVVALLGSNDDLMRSLAVRVLRRHGAMYEQHLLSLVHDPSTEVRRELMLAIRDLRSPEADAALIALARQWDGEDRYYLETIGIAARGVTGQAIDRFPTFRGTYDIMQIRDTRRMQLMFDTLIRHNQDPIDTKAIALTRLLRPASAEAYLLERLKQEGVAPESQALIVSLLKPISGLDAGRDLLRFVDNPDVSPNLRRLSLATLGRNLKTGWAALREDPRYQPAVQRALDTPALRAEALALLEDEIPDWARASLVRLASSADVTDHDRITALQRLAELPDRQDHLWLLPLARDRTVSPTVQNALLGVLAKRLHSPSLIVLLRDSDVSEQTRLMLVERLGETTTGALWLLQAIRSQELPGNLRARVLAIGSAHVDTHVRILFSDLLPERKRPQTLGSVINRDEVLLLPGDVARGARVFHSTSAACSRCHQVDTQGRDVGPSLSVIGRKLGSEAMFDAIVTPSAAVSPGYATSIVRTDDGRVFAGFLTRDEQSGQVHIKQSDGSSISIPNHTIEKIVNNKLSLMPEQLAGSMTAQDLADLIAYLLSLKSSTQMISEWWTLGAFPNSAPTQIDRDFGPEANAGRIDHAAIYDALSDRRVSWKRCITAPFQGSRGVDLQEYLARERFRKGDVIVYFAIGIDSPGDQSIQLQLGSEDGIKVWLNGDLLHRNLVRRSPAQPAQDIVSTTLRRGHNVMLVKLEQIGAGGGLLAAIQARYDVTFSKP